MNIGCADPDPTTVRTEPDIVFWEPDSIVRPATFKDPVIITWDPVLTVNMLFCAFPIIWNILLFWEIEEEIWTGILKSNNLSCGVFLAVLAVKTVVGHAGLLLTLSAKNLKVSLPSLVNLCIWLAALLPKTIPRLLACDIYTLPDGNETSVASVENWILLLLSTKVIPCPLVRVLLIVELLFPVWSEKVI